MNAQLIPMVAPLAVLVLLVALTRAAVQTDIEYGRAGETPLLLDVGMPEAPGPHPVILFIHGGGWGRGDKAEEIAIFSQGWNDAGFVWFSINYRLAPANRWPAAYDDVQRAIRWVKAHAHEYGGDPNRIALAGYSAGGQLAFLSATRADQTTRVQAVFALAPPTDFEQDLAARGGLSKSLQDLLDRPQEVTDASRAMIRSMSPINHLRPGLPPFLIMQGADDKTVPLEQSQNFKKRCDELGIDCQLIIIPLAGHRISEWRERDADFEQKLVSWLKTKLTGEAATSQPSTLPTP